MAKGDMDAGSTATFEKVERYPEQAQESQEGDLEISDCDMTEDDYPYPEQPFTNNGQVIPTTVSVTDTLQL